MKKIKKLRKLVYGVGVTDIPTRVNGIQIKSYCKWMSMLVRCYSLKFHEKNPTYAGCSVCNEWLTFSNYKKWFEIHNRPDLEVDKDILVRGNKVYGPDYCRFIPSNINSFLNDHGNARGNLPQGVTKHKNRYRAQCSVDCKKLNIGVYSTPTEAFQEYKTFKENVIKETSQTAYDQGLIELDVYTALQNWIIYP